MTGLHTFSSAVRRARFSLLLVVLAAAAVRLYLAITATVIARDGVVYVTMARRMATDWRGEIAQDYPLGFPFLVLWVHRLLGAGFSADPVLAWQRSGQFVCLVAGIVCVLLVFFIAQRLFNTRVALLAAWIWALLPQAAALSADALTDIPHLALMLAGLLSLMHAMSIYRRYAAVTCGVLSGCAYTLRTEGLELALVGLIAPMLVRHLAVSHRLALTLCVAVGFASVGGSYTWLEGGRLINKQRWLGESAQARATFPADVNVNLPLTHCAGLSSLPRAAGEILEKLTISLNGVWLVLAIVAPFLLRGRARRAGWIAPTMLGSIHLAALFYLYDQTGYISGRHLLLINVGLVVIAAASLNELSRRAAPRIGVRRAASVLIVSAIIFACLSPWLLRDIHGGRDYIKQCAEWLRTRHEGDSLPGIVAPDGWVPFYAGAVHWGVCKRVEVLEQSMELTGVRWLITESEAPSHLVIRDTPIHLRESARFGGRDTRRRLILYDVLRHDL